jgi:cobalt-zinc-cadmium efflux system membrane fusion protein
VNDDLLSHIVPRVPGSVSEVFKRLGDPVKKGDVLAILDSRELADAKADYLAALERLALEEANYSQEERVYKKNISSERDYLNAKKAVAEARINMRSARQKLMALGLSQQDISDLPEEPDERLTSFEITAPFDGTIIEKHITMGETIKDDDETPRFVIANMSSVWVNLQIYQKDLPFIREGKTVVISPGHGIPDVQGIIEYVGPIVDEQTRTAVARIVLENKNGQYRPGLFVTAEIELNHTDALLCVEKDAVQVIDKEPVVFIEAGHGYSPQPVKLGRSDKDHVEILAGLSRGQRYVAKGAFDLKAHMLTSNMDPHAGHNH